MSEENEINWGLIVSGFIFLLAIVILWLFRLI